MQTHTFTIKSGSKEVPARFHGQEITYSYPNTLEEIRAAGGRSLETFVPKDGEEKPTVDNLVENLCLKQGVHLNIQKAIKAELDTGFVKTLDVEAGIAQAVKAGEANAVPVPGRTKGSGKASKVARAEARATKAEQQAEAQRESMVTMYTALPKNVRKSVAADLVQRGIFTEEEIAEMDKKG